MAEVTDGRRVVQASEILDKIQKGKPVEYEDAIIMGDLDLNKLGLKTQRIERPDFQKSLSLPEVAKIVISPITISNSIIQGEVRFSDAIFEQQIFFENTRFSDDVSFRGTRFNGDTFFIQVQFNEYAFFTGTRFCRIAFFGGSQFDYDAFFDGVQFNEDTVFDLSKFSGDVLTFRNTEFSSPSLQEDACRRAKNVLEKNGDREEAGYHFYREMDGKRRQKPWYKSYLELIFIQWIFGYGVHPLRLWACWLGFVGLFAILYWLGNGIDEVASQLNGPAQLKDYIWFSIATAVTPGYAGYKPTPDFKLVAGVEAIFGTFMWAAFIATFARKYMR